MNRDVFVMLYFQLRDSLKDIDIFIACYEGDDIISNQR